MESNSLKERTILEHAWKSTIYALGIKHKDVDKLREVGLSDAEIVEVQAMIGLELLSPTFVTR
jgi:alkylhydroperoxidase family enzyme